MTDLLTRPHELLDPPPEPVRRQSEPAPSGPTGSVPPGGLRRQAKPVTVLSLLAWGALVALTSATVIGLCRVFPDWSYLPKMLIVAVGVHAACLGARALGRGTVVMTLAGIAALAVLTARLYLDGWPRRATWDLGWEQLADVWRQFPTAVAPVPSVGGFALGLTLVIGFVAVLSEIFAFRAFGRAEATVPAFLVFVIGASLGFDRNRLAVSLLWLGTAIVVVALLRNAHSEGSRPWLAMPSGRRAANGNRASSGRRATTVLAGALPLLLFGLPLAVIAGSHLPGSHKPALIDTRNRRGDNVYVISPLVNIRARLNQRSNVELFTVKTDRPRYLRLTASSKFDGEEWLPEDEYSPVTLGETLDGSGGTPLEHTVRISLLGDRWVPTVFSPQQILRSSTDLLHSSITGSIMRDGDNLSEGLTVELVSTVPDWTADQLRTAPFGANPGDQYVELPPNFPLRFFELAREITAEAATPYDQALMLQNYFLDFDYDKNYQADNSIDGIDSFLAARRGFCQQFAGTFAALARTLGLPSRVAAGTTWGDRDANGLYHVKGKHAHAWPEIYFEGFGWIEFEPTPGRGQPGSEAITGRDAAQDGGTDTGESDRPDQNPRDPSPTPTLPGGPRPTAPPRSAPNIPDLENRGGTGVPRAVVQQSSLPVTPLILLGLLAAAVAWMFGMPNVMRRRLERRSDDGRVVLSQQWRASERALALAGLPPSPGETPLEFANRSRSALGKVKADFVHLADSVTSATYSGRQPAPQEIDDAMTTRRALQRTLRMGHSWKVKLWGRISPRAAEALG